MSSATRTSDDSRPTFVLQSFNRALLGLMDGSVSTLAPILAAAGLTVDL
jgi:erythrin-vacuolar iron transport family protein